MTSSPYQSNLLRFFVRQYQQGMNRHRLAVRKTRSSIALGSELGVAIAITPAYAVMRAAQNIGRKAGIALEHAVDRLRLPAGHSIETELSDLSNLLDLSGFVGLPISMPRSRHDEDIVAIDLSECEADSSNALVELETVMAKVLILAGESLLPKQRNQLSGQLSWWQSFAVKAKRWAERVSMTHLPIVRSHSSIRLSADKESQESVNSRDSLSSTEHQKITGLASDIATQSLVLVLGNVTIWNGLSANQKEKIQAKIDAFLGREFSGVETALPSVTSAQHSLSAPAGVPDSWLDVSQAKTSQIIAKTSQALSVVKNDLVRPIHSFWVAVLQMMSDWFHHTEETSRSKQLASGFLKLPTLSSLLQRASDNFRESQLRELQYLTPVHSEYILTAASSMSAIQCAVPGRTARTISHLDATVISVDYIEHPLEKVLKWVDRFLVWIEHWWQRLLDCWQYRQGKK